MRHHSFSCIDQKMAYFVVVILNAHLGYLASPVTMVTSVWLLYGEGL